MWNKFRPLEGNWWRSIYFCSSTFEALSFLSYWDFSSSRSSTLFLSNLSSWSKLCSPKRIKKKKKKRMNYSWLRGTVIVHPCWSDCLEVKHKNSTQHHTTTTTTHSWCVQLKYHLLLNFLMSNLILIHIFMLVSIECC